MIKNKKSKLFTVVLISVITGSLLSGCGNSSSSSSNSNPSTPTGVQKITANIDANPKTIDPGLNDSVEGMDVITNAFEGLTTLDANNKVIPGIASSWDVSKDGLNYVFHLRKDAKWSDGKPVTAHDFEYAWKRALNPATASDYAYQLYYLKNGESYNTGGGATANDVGVKAVDDYTLDVTLQNPTPYFLSLMAFDTYMPVRQDIVEAHPNDWATNPATYVSDGPFKLKQWNTNDRLILVKNPYYWNAKNVKLQELDLTVLSDETSYMSAYQSGQIDVIDQPPTEQIPSLVKEGKAKILPNLGVYYYSFNLDPKATTVPADVKAAIDNPKVREAISLAINRTQIVNDVAKGGQKPATSFVPSGIIGPNGKDFKNKSYLPATADVTEAKKLLSEAGYPNGKNFPSDVELIYNSSQQNQEIAEAVQAMLKQNLNINISVRAVERKVQLTETTSHTYTAMARNAWTADYADPMTFLDMWTSTSGNNVSGWSDPTYDALIAKAKAETNLSKRYDEMHQAQDILMNSYSVIPIYEYTEVECKKDYVKGAFRTSLDVLYFRDAYVHK